MVNVLKGNIEIWLDLRSWLDSSCQNTLPQKLSAQTDQRFQSYGLAKFSKKWLCLDQFLKNQFF